MIHEDERARATAFHFKNCSTVYVLIPKLGKK